MLKSSEFILEPEQKQLLVLEPMGMSYASVLQSFATRTGGQTPVQVVLCANTSELIPLIRQVSICVVIAHCQNASQAKRYDEVLLALRAEIFAKKARVIITVSGDLLQLKGRFLQAGAAEVIQETSNNRTLYVRIEHSLNVLPERKLPPKKTKGEKEALAAAIEGVKPAAAVKEVPPKELIRWIPPIFLESDCWLTIRESIRSLAGKWNISMMGPPPRFGQWCPVRSPLNEAAPQPVTQAGENWWEWIPTDLLDDPFIHEEGAWFYYGQKPEFTGGTWQFVGVNPELGFYYKNDPYGARFSVEEKTLVIAEDSENARKASELMEKRTEATSALPIAARNAEAKAAEVKANEAKANEAKMTESQVAGSADGEAPSETVETSTVVIEVQKAFFVTEPLSLLSDCFSREERIPRYMNNLWVMKLAGPTPTHGKWEIVRRDEGQDAVWKWSPKEGEPFIKDQGNWTFQGNQPQFRDGLWTFIGNKARLEFVTNVNPSQGRILGTKISVDSRGALSLAEDSGVALTALEQLQSLRKRPPAYLKRAYGNKIPVFASKGLFANSPVHPITCAFFVSELMKKKDATLEKILQTYATWLERVIQTVKVEIWTATSLSPDNSMWQCLQHTDLMDFSLLQKVTDFKLHLSPSEYRFKARLVSEVEPKAAIALCGNDKVGLIVFSGEGAARLTEREIEAYTKTISGVWLSLHALIQRKEKEFAKAA